MQETKMVYGTCEAVRRVQHVAHRQSSCPFNCACQGQASGASDLSCNQLCKPVINCHIMLEAASYPTPSAAFIYYCLHVVLCPSIKCSPW